MRVVFAEETARAALSFHIAEFHRTARESLDATCRTGIHGASDVERLEVTLTREARRIAAGLRVEIRPLSPTTHELVVATDGDAGFACVADEIVRLAPVHEQTRYLRHGAPLSLEEALSDVRTRTGFDLASAKTRVGFSRGHLMDVVVYNARFASGADEDGLAAADLVVARLLGDLDYHRWIGAVDIAPMPRGGSLRVVADAAAPSDAALPIAELGPAVRRGAERLRESLPLERCSERHDREDWTLLELEPVFAEDYASLDDLALVSTMMPEAVKCFLQGSRFDSSRFSRFDERVLYAKLDAKRLCSDERHALRVAAEDAVNRALVAANVGAVVGAGVGLRYVYVFVAIEKLDAGVHLMRECLRSLAVSPRSWISFCDAGWEHEWVGVWDDAPAPP